MGDISISVIINIIFLVSLVWQLLGGLFRGFIRQTLHIACTIMAAAVAFMVTEAVLEAVVMTLDDHTFNDFLLGLLEEGNELAGFIPYMTCAEWILVLPAATVCAPVIFTALFIVFNLLLKIAYAIVSIFIPKRVFKLGGAALGAVEGLLITAMILFPAISLVDVAEDTVDVFREKDDGKYTEIIEIYDSYANQITENSFFTLVNDAVCHNMVDSFATITVGGKETNMLNELDRVVLIVLDLSSIEKNDGAQLSAEHKNALISAADAIEESPYLTELISSMLSDMGRAAEDNALPIKIDDSLNTLVNSMFHVFATSNKDNLHSDIDTLLEVYFILNDSGTLKAYGTEGGEEMMENALTETDDKGVSIITKVINKLNENEHMQPVITAITEMTIKMLAGQLGLDYDTLNAYNDIKDGISNVLSMDKTADGYEQARDAEINKVLTEQGVELDEATVNEIGDYIDANFADATELSDENLNEILLYYFETWKFTE